MVNTRLATCCVLNSYLHERPKALVLKKIYFLCHQLQFQLQLQLQLRLYSFPARARARPRARPEPELQFWLCSLISDRQPLARFVHWLGVIVVAVVVVIVVDVLQIAIFKFLLCFILDCHGQYKNMYVYTCVFLMLLNANQKEFQEI